MSKIKSIIAKEIKDSRGKSTIECFVETDKGEFFACVPSGVSTGKNEALELRDADGKGVLVAIKNVNEIIAPKLRGRDVLNQTEIDKLMIDLDGTENKSKLGANAILSVSMAVARAGAACKKISLYKHIAELSNNSAKLFIPLPMFNILNGGAHAKNDLDIQEFMIVPQKKTIQENLVLCNSVFNKLQEAIKTSFGENHLDLGDEGGFAPPISSAERALFLLKGACEGQDDVRFALDSAASEFFDTSAGSVGKYNVDGQELTRSQMIKFYKNLAREFPIISFEDPFAEEDWEGFKEFTKEMPDKIIIGDDLTTTNIKRIKEAHNKSAINGVLIKLNQIGTLSETLEAINMTKSFGWKVAVSHRSGETMDDFIADLAVGAGADFLKAGSPAKEERMVKYTRLIQIEKELNKK
ncbi:MAG: phosphopyruvate hydratase [Candidatus Staskawiczbacteria bacterium RIFOXYD1_FULL_39_28]|uniref:Enolase n=1 Tax=Candidatus Staskawiczbacteria bacterium RIFOXYC1_FULL_38_18 TaxID=1802229 RepID=A0A1G2JEL0_9BACT|nr:MAG: phosphopyruvate hydratase [Candidatus Staskawiczbacteria bacterium RIFOXYC1_FULL_38_18]OGZ92391.1 MAG: phosphopyruvate hydratase [Candidatus Staskawiczbacteria bacterium RIFOXYD1_FULL_39_28]